MDALPLRVELGRVQQPRYPSTRGLGRVSLLGARDQSLRDPGSAWGGCVLFSCWAGRG